MLKFNNFIYEMDFNIIQTEYTINETSLDGHHIDVYSFISDKGNSYSVYFSITSEDDEKLSSGDYLSEYTDLNKIPTIFFSLTDRGFGKNFDNLTNRNEFLEVMGKVVFIIKRYIEKNDYTVYSIGSVGDDKIKFYNYYRKYFNEFTILNGLSSNYPLLNNIKPNIYYLIKGYKYPKLESIKFGDRYFKFYNKKGD